MHLLGTGDTDLAQIESLVKVSELPHQYSSKVSPNSNLLVPHL
jgi:hypothetical protein